MTDEKVAIVTGCSSGIGRADAVNLANEGVKIVAAARRANEGEETVHLKKLEVMGFLLVLVLALAYCELKNANRSYCC